MESNEGQEKSEILSTSSACSEKGREVILSQM